MNPYPSEWFQKPKEDWTHANRVKWIVGGDGVNRLHVLCQDHGSSLMAWAKPENLSDSPLILPSRSFV